MTRQEAMRLSVEIVHALPGHYSVIGFPEDPVKGHGVTLLNPVSGLVTLWTTEEWECR